MTRFNDCSWNDQWRCGWLTNPTKRGQKYYADLKMHVYDKSLGPQDYDYSHNARGQGFILVKEVEIPHEVYRELSE